MFTTQPIEPLTPRLRTRPAMVLTTLGVLVAIALTIGILALTGTHHTTITTPATTSQAAASATPHTQYLGPRQQQASNTSHGGASAAAHYSCLGAAQRCLR
jgi:hypothetical protein